MKRSWAIAAAVFILGLFVLWKRSPPSTDPTPAAPPIIFSPPPTEPAKAPTPSAQAPAAPAVPTVSAPPQRKAGRPFYGDLPRGVGSLQALPMANRPSADWPKRVEDNLRRVGGGDLKTLEIAPQESYIILDGQEGRYVERVVVTVTSKDGRFTRFFAEVDSQSGHVTKTWGATIHD
jgi:hypothetical protein